MSSIYDLLAQIENAVYGKDVRGSIHDAIEQCYVDATGNPASLSNLISSLHDLGDVVEMEPVQITSLETDTEYFLGSNTIYLSPGAWIIEYGLTVGPHDSQSLSAGDSGEIFVANTATRWYDTDAERIFTYRYGVPNQFRHFVFVDENNPIWEEVITGDDPNAGKAPVYLHLYNSANGFALDARIFIKAICLKKQGSDEPGGSIEEQVAQNTADISLLNEEVADVKQDLLQVYVEGTTLIINGGIPNGEDVSY